MILLDDLCTLYTFNLRDQQTKRDRVLKNNKIWKAFAHTCLLCDQDKNQFLLM